MKLFLLGCILFFSSCAERNTRSPAEFSIEVFENIEVGIERDQVESRLGKSLSYYTHVIYHDGKGNNYKKILEHDPSAGYKVFRYVAVYSSPIDQKSDHRVYEIYYDENWITSGKQTFVTD